ncbi:hypothetical protein [Paenibacillus thiaminolyticus]|uniref:hypothetical protein n=1 Tax=Paenibacillus thiaminolyticus TaxID=49283 RepID=UPI002542FE48|nr:hypothetical protein [Paenibacillus thiaminolyticus]WII35817.1 hypothetical protein O0V01_19255 [Paenibacillus thiaminolyticus]
MGNEASDLFKNMSKELKDGLDGLKNKLDNVMKSSSGGSGGTGKPSSGDRVAVPKPPKQVGYGETDLSLRAQQHRVENKIFDLRNLVVADIEIDGVRTLKVFKSTERTVENQVGK